MPSYRSSLRLFGLGLLLAGAIAAEYAVAPPPLGSDAGNGKADAPWASLRHALGRAGSGDTIHVVRGGTYREAALDFPAGVTIAAIGPETQPAPVITTSLVVPALTPWERNAKVLVARVDRPVLACYVDGRFQVLARYPNQGWMRTRAGTTPDMIVDPERARQPRAAASRWTGAQVRWRRWSWWWETRPITGDDGVSRISLGPDGRFQDPFTGEGSAWCVDNCLAELDAPGEWFWEASSSTLYVYPPADGAKPVVEVVVEPKGYRCSGATLDGLAFARIAGNALEINRRSTIRACAFSDLEDNAIRGNYDAFGTVISGCTFRDVRNVAISWGENPGGAGGTVFERNRLERIGMQPGYGGSGSWHAAGVIIYGGKAVTMRLNRVVDTGYAGVILGGDGQVVERNVFVRCMGQLNDGAAIYANCSKTVIRDNIVLDTVGNLDTSQFWYPLGHGIWPEFLGDFREQQIIGNTVFGSGGSGLFLPNNFACQVRDNTFVGNRLAGMRLEGKRNSQGNSFAGNVVATLDPPRRLTFPEQIPANWKGNDRPRGIDAEAGTDYGTMTGTVFINSPGTPIATIGDRSFEEGAALRQAAVWADPSPTVLRATALLLINDTEQPADLAVPSGGWHGLDGKAAGRTVAIAPFRSAVLVRAGDGPGLPPYVLASGIDYRAPPGEAQTAKAKARATTARAAAAEPARPAAKARPEAWGRYVARLRECTALAARGPRQPSFDSTGMRAGVTVLAVDGDQATVRIAGGGDMTANLFGRISPADALALARVVARTDDAQDQAMAAFFARCAGDSGAYQDHLGRAGGWRDEVEGAFASPP